MPKFNPEFDPRAVRFPGGAIPIIRPQQEAQPKAQPPPFDPNYRYKITLLREHGNQEFWMADPQDPEELDEEVTFLDGTRAKQKRFALSCAVEVCLVEMRRCYSRTGDRVVTHVNFTSVGTPFTIERVPKPEWWKAKDGAPVTEKLVQ